MDKEYVVIVDSMADFEIGFSDPNVVVINTPVTIGGEDFTDATPDEFYDKQKEVFERNIELKKLGHSPIAIKTSTPSPARIEDEMRKILASGRDAIYVATASTLTSAFSSGVVAAQMIEEDGEFKNHTIVIDGLSMSALTAVLVRTALRECNTTDEFVRFIYDRRNDTEHFFAVEEWDAFRDSGRIKPRTLMIASLIGVKPLMRFDFNDEGTREAFCEKKHRHLKALCMHAAKTLVDTIDGNYCMVIHAQNERGAEMMKDTLLQVFPTLIIRSGPEFRMGPATGVHLGYSAIGLAFVRKKGKSENAELHRTIQTPEDSIFGYSLLN